MYNVCSLQRKSPRCASMSKWGLHAWEFGVLSVEKIHLLFVVIASDINEQEHIFTLKQGAAIKTCQWEIGSGNKRCLLALILASSLLGRQPPPPL